MYRPAYQISLDDFRLLFCCNCSDVSVINLLTDFQLKGSCIHKRFKMQSVKSVKTLKWVIMKNLLPLLQSVLRTSIRCGMAVRLKGCRSTLTPWQTTAASPLSSKVDGRTWTWSPHPKRRPSGGSAVWRRSWLACTASTDSRTVNSILERPFLKACSLNTFVSTVVIKGEHWFNIFRLHVISKWHVFNIRLGFGLRLVAYSWKCNFIHNSLLFS